MCVKFLTMTSRRTPEGPNRKTNPLTNFFKATKPLIPFAENASFKPPAPIPASASVVQPLSGPTSKRRASTSAPSSPTTLRPPRKRPAPPRALPIRGVPSLRAHWPAKSPLYSLRVDAESNSSLGSASDRSASVSSQSTDSLASGGSKARTSGVRAGRDARDAKRVLRTIKQVKGGTYHVKKGAPGGKYLIHRTLHPSGYKLLREVELKRPENSELLEYFNGDKFR